MGSSFLPSEINAAFLYAQLENLDDIQSKRQKLWEQYFVGLQQLAGKGLIRLPQIPGYATNNAHMFYIVCRNLEERSGLIKFLKEHESLLPSTTSASIRAITIRPTTTTSPSFHTATCMQTA
mgnify:CR=1 FL=1